MKAAKKQFLTIAFILVYTVVGTAQDFHWVKEHKGNISDNFGHSIVVDAAGNTYTTGYFQGRTDFDPNAGILHLTALKNDDIFVCKFDSSGALVWAKSMGGSDEDHGTSIAIDASGNTYITGYFKGTSDFDPGVGVTNLSSAGLKDIFVVKLDPSGNFSWAKSIGGKKDDIINSIALDLAGCIYITGAFQDTTDFDFGIDTVNLISAGSYDIFICKIDTWGNLGWAKRIGSTGYDNGKSIKINTHENIYITGHFQNIVDFDSGIDTINLGSSSNLYWSTFICKFDTSGNILWAKSIEGNNYVTSYSIVVDTNNNSYITGSFKATADFDPGSGVFNLTSIGNTDLFITKLDSAGAFLWVKRIESANPYSITIDLAENIHLLGRFSGTVDFDPGIGISTIQSISGYYTFISKFNSHGDFLWVKRMGGESSGTDNSIAVDLNGNVHATGCFGAYPRTVDFDPNVGIANLTAKSTKDAYVFKLNYQGDYVWAKQIGEINGLSRTTSTTLTRFGTIYTVGHFTGTIDIDPSISTQNLVSASIEEEDIFICKYDTSGNFLWGKSIGSQGSDGANAVAVDAAGNVFITGFFEQTVDFDPGTGVFNLSSSPSAAFVLKLNPSGNFIWAKQMNMVDGYIVSIKVGISGNIYLTGAFRGTVDFDPDIGIFNLSSSANGEDAFVCKLNNYGGFIWAKNMVGTGVHSTDVSSMALDANENVYSTGYFGGTINLNPNTTGVPFNISSPGYHIYISKLDSLGNFVWGKQVTGPSSYHYIHANSIAVDAAANVYITARSAGPFHSEYILLQKYNSSGVQVWATSIYGGWGNSIAVDDVGNIYTAGSFYGVVDFDPSASVYNLSALNIGQNYIAKYNTSGNFVWAKQIAASTISVIQVDDQENIYAAGSFSGTPDFDTGVDTFNITEPNTAAFLLKLGSTPLSITYTDFTSWNFYPNPTNDKITIEVSSPDEIIEIQIFNSLGQLISNKSVNYVTNITLAMPQETGIYFVAIRAANGKKGVLKVVKE